MIYLRGGTQPGIDVYSLCALAMQCSSYTHALFNRLLVAHLAEEIHHAREDDEQDTSTRTQSQHLGQEALVQRREALFSRDNGKRTPRPVVLGQLTGNLWRVLNTRLDHVHGGIENRSHRSSDRTRNQIIRNLALLGRRSRQERANLEDAAKVARVPEDVAPHGGLEALVEGERAFLLDDLGHAVDHAIVLVRLGAVLQADLDELEGHDDEGFGGAGGCAGEDGERLVHFVDAEEVAVKGAPGVVGGELGGPWVC
jgi:hypothetical protein